MSSIPVIDPKFKDLIPPLAPEELSRLEDNMKADGCRDPLVTWRGVLLDGHNRLSICQRLSIPFKIIEMEFADESAAQIWVIENQFGRRNLAAFTKGELALKLEPLLRAKARENQGKRTDLSQNSVKSVDTQKDLARIAGLSHDTIAKIKIICAFADEETKKRLRENQISIHRVAKDIGELIQREERKAMRVQAAKASPELDSRMIVGDFRKHATKVADGSVSLIFTDPPYDRKASRMLPDLGEFAATKLSEGGSLILYVGQTQIPAALDALRPHLRYWWTIACVHAGGSTVMREYGINAGWKAVLWFVKGTRDNNSVMVSDVMSGGEEKEHHDWQQSESEAAYWIEKLCPKDGLVCDPFIGGGTTAAASKRLGRDWIGFEIDESAARIATARIATERISK